MPRAHPSFLDLLIKELDSNRCIVGHLMLQVEVAVSETSIDFV
jgi:hypothetical protein